MKLSITITLDSGGTVRIEGEDLTQDDVEEVFSILSGYTVEEGGRVDLQPQDEPLSSSFMEQSFLEGFNEGRTQQQEKT